MVNRRWESRDKRDEGAVWSRKRGMKGLHVSAESGFGGSLELVV